MSNEDTEGTDSKGEVGLVGTGMYDDYHKCKGTTNTPSSCGQAATHPDDKSQKPWCCSTHWVQHCSEQKKSGWTSKDSV